MFCWKFLFFANILNSSSLTANTNAFQHSERTKIVNRKFCVILWFLLEEFSAGPTNLAFYPLFRQARYGLFCNDPKDRPFSNAD
jgi:hypothetical protein